MKKAVSFRVSSSFLENLDDLIKRSNDLYVQAIESSDFEILGHFDRIRHYRDRSDFIVSALFEVYIELKYELDHFKEN